MILPVKARRVMLWKGDKHLYEGITTLLVDLASVHEKTMMSAWCSENGVDAGAAYWLEIVLLLSQIDLSIAMHCKHVPPTSRRSNLQVVTEGLDTGNERNHLAERMQRSLSCFPARVKCCRRAFGIRSDWRRLEMLPSRWLVQPHMTNTGAMIRTLNNDRHDAAVRAIVALTVSGGERTCSGTVLDNVHRSTKNYI
ncbi:hypothetical protein B0H13DRAFT_1855939 [Mycena leptocephala]|nr:hypothetical protein B0H13DRAFT_1855939 [Mycena leptocephala]